MQAPRHTPIVILLLVAAGAAGFGVYQWVMPGSTPAPAPSAMQPTDKPMTQAQGLSAKFDDLSDGGTRSLNDWHGKAVIVNFWATWCAPCREEMPLLVKLQAQYAAQGLQVVGIATDETDVKDVKTFLTKMTVNYPILMGDESVGRLVAGFGGQLIGLPFTLVLDKDGHVITSHAGQLDPQEAQALVQAALGLAPAPAAASVAPKADATKA